MWKNGHGAAVLLYGYSFLFITSNHYAPFAYHATKETPISAVMHRSLFAAASLSG